MAVTDNPWSAEYEANFGKEWPPMGMWGFSIVNMTPLLSESGRRGPFTAALCALPVIFHPCSLSLTAGTTVDLA